MTERQCGECQLCCRVLPVRELGKGAHDRCVHQKFMKGCNNYAHRPMSCRLWNCRWLVNDDADGMKRPDRAGYVIDIMPDFITLRPHDGSPDNQVQVVQIWADAKRPMAYRDPALLAWLERKYEANASLGLVRFDSKRAVLLIPPAMTGDGWAEMDSNMREAEHSAAEIVDFMKGAA